MAKTSTTTRPIPRRGVALILALFTTAILVTLSLAFLALAIGESRNSRSASYEKAALEAANFSIEFTLNYMGLGTNTSPLGQKLITWQRDISPGGFGFYNTLVRVSQPRPHLIAKTGIVIEDITDDSTLVRFEPDVNLKDSLRKLRLVKLDLPKGGGKPEAAILPLGNELGYTFEVVIVPVLPSNGVESFRLISTTRVYRQEVGSTTVVDQPLATRVVEAQVLPESAASYLHFISHGRGLNAQGIEKYSNQSVTIGGKTTSVVDYAMIPGNFSENGPMRVDGEDPALANGPGGAPDWLKNSGSLKFAPGAVDKKSGGNVTFQERLTIKAASNDYSASGLDDTNSGFFSGGFSTNTPRLGLPQLDLVNITKASQDVPNPNPQGYRPGYFSVESREIPGAEGSSVAAPRCQGPNGDPFYERYDPEMLDGQIRYVPVAFDYRPRIPNVEISISADQVTVQKRDNLSGKVVGSPETFRADKLASGVVFVEGGNAVVKTTEAFKGQLSVVAGDHLGRAGGNANDQIYSQAASEFFAYEKKRWDQARADGGPVDPSTFATPPYTVKQLQAAKNAQIITSDVPSLADGHTLWPSPPKAVTREGNLVIADDVVTTRDRGATLGLFAQNFVLINDNTPEANNHQLILDAVMMSRDHTVTLDWDNTGRQPLESWKKMTAPGFNGVLQLRGSVVGEFVDIEGDTAGRGYIVQDFQHNPNLRNLRPPLCPAWDFSLLPGGFRFVITHYSDKGALGTDKAL